MGKLQLFKFCEFTKNVNFLRLNHIFIIILIKVNLLPIWKRIIFLNSLSYENQGVLFDHIINISIFKCGRKVTILYSYIKWRYFLQFDNKLFLPI